MDKQTSSHCCQSRAAGLKTWSWRSLIIAVCLLSQARSSLQAEYSFTGEPPGFYYIMEGHSAVLPCAAEVTLDDGTVQPISPSILVNSEPLDIFDIRADTRIFAELSSGVVVGIFLLRTQASDNGTVLECVVRNEDSTVVLSATTHLHVGDGRPLRPALDPAPNDESLYSITLSWGMARAPQLSPITHYTIQLIELLAVEREILFEVTTNNTNAEVTGLQPGTMYRIYVYGVNAVGDGVRSDYVIGMTASPSVPLPPTGVSVEVRERGSVCDIILSWTPTPIEPDLMTPITHYVIYYGPDESMLFNHTTTTPTVTRFNMSGWTEKGVWFVGVASANSAGVSTFSLEEIVLQPHEPSSEDPTGTSPSTTQAPTTDDTETPGPSSLNLIIMVAICGGIFILLLAILAIVVIIAVVHCRRKRLTQAENSYELPPTNHVDELDGSPYSIKRLTRSYSPKQKNRESVLSSYMNSDYDREPHRAGSTPPADK